MRTLAAMVAFLLFLSIASPLWTQNVSVSVKDSSGASAENIDVLITYQKLSGISFGDGEIKGKTNENGAFSAVIINSVPMGFSKDYFKVKASSNFWTGKEYSISVSPSKTSSVDFSIPMKLERIAVNVTDIDNRSVRDATVYISEINIQKATLASGFAIFQVPESSSFIGVVTYGKTSASFTSAGTHVFGGLRTIDVKLPVVTVPKPPPSTGVLRFTIQVLGIDRKPVPDQLIDFNYLDMNESYATNGSGHITFYVNQSCTVNASVSQYEHEYRNSYPLIVRNNTKNQFRNEQLVLKPLLIVNAFRSYEESPNCHVVQAYVSDPRAYLPLDVKIFKKVYLADQNITVNVSLPVGLADDGAYTSRLCIRTITPVRLVVSNLYETAYREMNLTYRIPPPPEPPKPPKSNALSTQEVILSIGAVMIILGLLIGFIIGRRYLSMIARFMIEYLRMMVRVLQSRGKGGPGGGGSTGKF